MVTNFVHSWRIARFYFAIHLARKTAFFSFLILFFHVFDPSLDLCGFVSIDTSKLPHEKIKLEKNNEIKGKLPISEMPASPFTEQHKMTFFRPNLLRKWEPKSRTWYGRFSLAVETLTPCGNTLTFERYRSVFSCVVGVAPGRGDPGEILLLLCERVALSTRAFVRLLAVTLFSFTLSPFSVWVNLTLETLQPRFYGSESKKEE